MGFEALAVDLARNNPYDREIIEWEDRRYRAAWRINYWIPEAKKIQDGARLEEELRACASELSQWQGARFEWPWEALTSWIGTL